MDGYAVHSSSTFGASESSPAWITVAGAIAMGDVPDFSIESGQSAKISTGGMLPDGADSVVMVEHTESVDATVEIYKSVAPLQNVIDSDEDFKKGEKILEAGTLIRPQEAGLAAALGICELPVYMIPRVGIISTGDEVVPVDQAPPPGKIRDINSHTLASLVIQAGAQPVQYGIIRDSEKQLSEVCARALDETDMVLVSGGSSVGTRDFTVDAISSLKDTRILVHGISISPGKPTILAKSAIARSDIAKPALDGSCSAEFGLDGSDSAKSSLAGSDLAESGFVDSGSAGSGLVDGTRVKPVWGLPGHAVSAMVVFRIVVLPFLNQIKGLTSYYGTAHVDSTAHGATGFSPHNIRIPAKLARNVASAQGRTDFIRVRLVREKNELLAVPVLGKSGLIRTMVMADGLLEIGENIEGLEKDQIVNIIPMF
ncbi:MAG: molybdopterin molybdotransferase MoeA [Desulfamplus sp.]|nr:molybdopterin molybdotransferase MoeA [Desulfamplus sp.]